ncbi:uncharacterized protein LOC124280176 [Haliotis rubra]|uniref:uncharacterized protein LOC124280176 n=1 Tax=Haliotis rubra TaxID=36100 RepID=UPI001EE4EBF6|nr:uncharacterized protein LOC124280176 [Haliotis rubra]
MWNHSIPLLRRPLTPVLEQPEDSSPPADGTCTFDPGYRLSSTDPQVIEDFVTSPHSVSEGINPLANDLSELEEQIPDVDSCPGDGGGTSVLDRTCHVYNKTCRAIDALEKQLVVIKRKLKKVSNKYSANHERATSAMSRHRMMKGLREVADDKVTLWREQCRNFELGYSQERPEFEQMKNIHSILKASMEELVERNKYLVSFVKLMKLRRLKQAEERNRAQMEAGYSGTAGCLLRRQFEEVLRHQLDARNMGMPAQRKTQDYQDLMKRFGRNMPRPPFAPLNVFKLNALAPYLGRSSVRYGSGQVYTLNVDINKQDDETFGRATPETKEHWVLAGRNCLHDQENVFVGDCFLSQSGMFGYSKLPSIRHVANKRQEGEGRIEGREGHISEPIKSSRKHIATEKRRTSKIKRSKCKSPSNTAARGRHLKSKSNRHSGKKSQFGVTLNIWGNREEVDADSIAGGELLTHDQPVPHTASNTSSEQTVVKDG